MFSLWSCPCFQGLCPDSSVCAEKGPGGQWAAEWRVQRRPTSFAPSAEYVLFKEQPYILSRFVELESAAGAGEEGVSDGEDLLLGDWHTTAACQLSELGTTCLFLFCFVFFRENLPLCLLHLLLLVPLLPSSTIPSIHLSGCPHCCIVDTTKK